MTRPRSQSYDVIPRYFKMVARTKSDDKIKRDKQLTLLIETSLGWLRMPEKDNEIKMKMNETYTAKSNDVRAF